MRPRPYSDCGIGHERLACRAYTMGSRSPEAEMAFTGRLAPLIGLALARLRGGPVAPLLGLGTPLLLLALLPGALFVGISHSDLRCLCADGA